MNKDVYTARCKYCGKLFKPEDIKVHQDHFCRYKDSKVLSTKRNNHESDI